MLANNPKMLVQMTAGELVFQVREAVSEIMFEYMHHFEKQAAPTTQKTMTTKQVREMYGIHPKRLKYWRDTGQGPHYIKRGRLYYYEQAEMDRFMASGAVMTTGEIGNED